MKSLNELTLEELKLKFDYIHQFYNEKESNFLIDMFWSDFSHLQ